MTKPTPVTLVFPTYSARSRVRAAMLQCLAAPGGLRVERVIAGYDRKLTSDAADIAELTALASGLFNCEVNIVEVSGPDSTAQHPRAIEECARLAGTGRWLLVQDDDVITPPAVLRHMGLVAARGAVDLVCPAEIIRLRPGDAWWDRPCAAGILDHDGVHVALRGSIAHRYMWWFTGQAKVMRSDMLIDLGTGHEAFAGYWWWDAALSLRLERYGVCASVPGCSYLIETERPGNWEATRDANRGVYDALLRELELS